MANTTTVSKTMSLGGKSFNVTKSLSAEQAQVREVSIAAAKGGTLSVRTDNDTGTVVADSGSHGITTGSRVDLYWSGGSRRGVTVGTVSGTSIPIDGGTGDNLPSASSDITIATANEYDLNVVGNDIEALFMKAGARGTIVIADGSNVELASRVFLAADNYFWYTDCGDTNPLAGDTATKVFMSHASEAGAATMLIGVLHD